MAATAVPDDTLYLYLPAAGPGDNLPDDGFAWRLQAADGSLRQAGQGDWAALASLVGRAEDAADSPGPQTLLVLPGEDVLLTAASVPARQARQALKALPFVVEEHLAADLEAQHLVPGPFQAGAPVPVAVVSRALLGGWQERLRGIGIEAQAAVPDVLLVPWQAGAATLVVAGERCLVRTDALAGLVLPLALAAEVLPEVLAASAVTRVQCRVCAPTDEHAALVLSGLQTSLATNGLEVDDADTDADADPQPLTELLSAGGAAGSPLSLLCGDFAPQRRKQDRSAAGWRSVAALAAGLAVVWLAGEAGRALWYERAAEASYLEASTVYRLAVPGTPGEGAVRNLRGRLRAAVGEAAAPGDGPGLVPLLGALAQQVGSSGGAFQLRSLGWNGARGELAVELAAPGFQQLDGFRDGLAARGLAVDIASAEQVQQQVQARLRLRAGGGA